MIKYYCDICGLEVESEEYENKVGIRLVKSGRRYINTERAGFCRPQRRRT